MAIHQPIGPLKTRSGLEPVPRYDPVPTSPLADDITTVPSGPVVNVRNTITFILVYAMNRCWCTLVTRAGLKSIGPLAPNWAPRPILHTLVQVAGNLGRPK